MNVFARAMVELGRLAAPGVAFTIAVFAAVLGVEVIGRHSPSDLHDLIAVFLLVMLGFLTAARHRRAPLQWVHAVGRFGERLLDAAKPLTFQMGLDLRGTPPVKRGTPPVIRWTLALLVAALIVLVPVAQWAPLRGREVLIAVSYLLYLGVLAGLWTALAAAILLAAFVPLAVIHDTLVGRHRGPGRRPRGAEAAALAGYFGAVFLIGSALPLWVAPALLAAMMTTYLAGSLAGRRHSVQFLWRPRGSVQVRSLSWARWVSWEFLLIGATVAVLTHAACGSLIWGGPGDAAAVMPLTTLAGVALAWLGPGLMTVLCVQMVLGLWRDPARPARPTAHLTDHGRHRRRPLRRLFAARGWRVRFAPAEPGLMDVRVELAAEALPRQTPPAEFPIVVTRAGLDRDGLFVRLDRRAEVQLRRRFFAGLETLLKQVAGKPRDGSGYWLSPHLWFVSGLMRDSRAGEETGEFDLGEDPILTGAVGPPFHRVFPRAVRRHVFEILRGAAIDLIFVEDGVSYKRLRKVLRVLFEVYDVHAGRRPAEEIDFRGLPGTRVLIHDFQFDEPFRSSHYPEPKYDFLGRARILHIFRDRGGDEELVEPPFDFGRRPAPAGAF